MEKWIEVENHFDDRILTYIFQKDELALVYKEDFPKHTIWTKEGTNYTIFLKSGKEFKITEKQYNQVRDILFKEGE